MDLSGAKFPFSVGQAIQGAFELIDSMKEFILLGIAFVVFYLFVNLIFSLKFADHEGQTIYGKARLYYRRKIAVRNSR